jgi:hypothetical protein
MTEALGMRDRVRLESEVDHIGVWPDSQNPPGPDISGMSGGTGTGTGTDDRTSADDGTRTSAGAEEGDQ